MSSAKRALKNAFIFSLSLILTVLIVGGGFIYFFPTSNKTTQVITKQAENAKDIKILLCDTKNELNYGITISFKENNVNVSRLYFKDNPYVLGGIPEVLKSAREGFGECEKALIVTETQLAAMIDYVGGVRIDVDSVLSGICGIDPGHQLVAGVSAIKIFQYEKNNTTLCLGIIKDLAFSWCKILSNKRDFFKLLDLSNSNISYTDYLPIQRNFENFQ